MLPTTSQEKDRLMQIEAELRQLKIDYQEMERQVDEKTSELLENNKCLQAEIVERKKIEREILEITQEEQRRFGTELHDGLCQELTGILMFAKGLIQKM